MSISNHAPLICIGVTARARSVNLMYSNAWKLHWKGRARTHPKQQHPVSHRRLAIIISMKTLLITGSPQTLPLASTASKSTQWCQHNGTVHHHHTITNPSHADRLSSSRTLPTIAPGVINQLGLREGQRSGTPLTSVWAANKPLLLVAKNTE